MGKVNDIFYTTLHSDDLARRNQKDGLLLVESERVYNMIESNISNYFAIISTISKITIFRFATATTSFTSTRT